MIFAPANLARKNGLFRFVRPGGRLGGTLARLAGIFSVTLSGTADGVWAFGKLKIPMKAGILFPNLPLRHFPAIIFRNNRNHNENISTHSMETSRTELNELGEFGLISRITAGFALQNPESLKGPGDDAAVIDNGTNCTLISTDMLLEGVHFDLGYTPLPHLGYKAVAVNVSDIAAMNGIPKQITVGLAMSNRFSVEAAEALYDGIRAACAEYKVDLVGGDTTSSRSGLVISVSVLGVADKDKIVYRHTAKPGDIVCVTGDLGGAYVGLQILEREKQVFLQNPEMQPELEGNDYVLQRQDRKSVV